jgi:hypothetical protein
MSICCELCGKEKSDTKLVFGSYPVMDSCYAYEFCAKKVCSECLERSKKEFFEQVKYSIDKAKAMQD